MTTLVRQFGLGGLLLKAFGRREQSPKHGA